MKEIHKPVAFEPLTSNSPDKFAVGSFGLSGTGKSRLGATMPGKIAVIPLDKKTRRTIERAQAELNLPKGKVLYPPVSIESKFIRHDKPLEVASMEPDKAIVYYREHLNYVKDAAFTLAQQSSVDSVFIDNGTQLWEDILFANYGRNQRIMPRDRGPANQEIKDLFNALQDKHLLITHQAKEVWKNDKPSGTYEWDGFSRLDFYMNCIVEHEFDSKKQEFYLSIARSQERPDLMGAAGKRILQDDAITFQMLALTIFEGSDPSDWE